MEIRTKDVRVYKTLNGVSPFNEWLEELSTDVQVQITKRIARLRLGNLGNYKPLGKGVFKLKFKQGPGYRVYFGMSNKEIILLLSGGHKGSQKRDIKFAQKLWNNYIKEQKIAN